jgi:hypothetical protein
VEVDEEMKRTFNCIQCAKVLSEGEEFLCDECAAEIKGYVSEVMKTNERLDESFNIKPETLQKRFNI